MNVGLQSGNGSVTPPTLLRTLATCLAGAVMAAFGAHAAPARPEADSRIVQEAAAAPREGPANILLVSLDTLRADFVREAPFLSRLARQGRSFSKAYASSNWTLPSHVSLLSSLSYFEHNVPPPRSSKPFLGSRIPFDQPTLAEVLRAAGYATAASTEGGWVTRHHGLARGFDSFETFARRAGDASSLDHHLAFARSFLRRSDGRPFFLFVHTYFVHDYFLNTQAYHQLLTPEDAPYVEYGNLLDRHRATLPLPPAAFVKRLYAAGVRATDGFVDRLVGAVRDESDDAPLLVVVTSDHGESLGENPGEFGHGSRLNDLQTRIPLIVWTNAARPLRGAVDSLASTIDVAPSVLRWVGLQVPARFRGRDDLLQPSPGPPSSPVLVQQFTEKEKPTVGGIRHALIWNDSKYVRSDRFDGTNVSEQCYPIPRAPEAEPRWGGRMAEECKFLRERFARSLEATPSVSFVLEGNRTVDMRPARSANGASLLAVVSAYPSPSPILSPDGALSWAPPASGAWLVGYPSDAQLSFSSIAVGGRTRFEDVRLVDLAASVLRASRAASFEDEESGGRFSVRLRGLKRSKDLPPTPDDGLRERLRALGYDRDE
jgi:arylsulfatase A-like enzyme